VVRRGLGVVWEIKREKMEDHFEGQKGEFSYRHPDNKGGLHRTWDT